MYTADGRKRLGWMLLKVVDCRMLRMEGCRSKSLTLRYECVGKGLASGRD